MGSVSSEGWPDFWAAASRPAFLVGQNVLQQYRNAGESAVKFRRRLCVRLVIALEHDCVEPRVVPLDALNRSLDKFGGLYLFLLHELGKPEAVKIRIFGKTHVSFLARG